MNEIVWRFTKATLSFKVWYMPIYSVLTLHGVRVCVQWFGEVLCTLILQIKGTPFSVWQFVYLNNARLHLGTCKCNGSKASAPGPLRRCRRNSRVHWELNCHTFDRFGYASNFTKSFFPWFEFWKRRHLVGAKGSHKNLNIQLTSYDTARFREFFTFRMSVLSPLLLQLSLLFLFVCGSTCPFNTANFFIEPCHSNSYSDSCCSVYFVLVFVLLILLYSL